MLMQQILKEKFSSELFQEYDLIYLLASEFKYYLTFIEGEYCHNAPLLVRFCDHLLYTHLVNSYISFFEKCDKRFCISEKK